MSTIEQNELFAILRDVANQSLTVGDAQERIQGLTKSEMKEEVTETIPPAELAVQVAEARTEALEEQEDNENPEDEIVAGVEPGSTKLLDTNEEGEPEVVKTSNKRKPRNN